MATLAGSAGNSGSADGTGSEARFNYPEGMAVDGAGNVFVADEGNHTIRKVTAAGVVTTIGGTATNSGSADGTSRVARFSYPSGVAVDSAGNIYVADRNNHTIRKGVPVATPTKIIGLSGSLAFGSVRTGATATATLTIGGIGYPGGFSGAWSGAIAAGGSQNVTVTFAPVAVATYTGTVTVASDKTSGGNAIGASGTGTAWRPEVQADESFGVRTNRFGFNINWAGGRVVVVDACTNLAHPIWSPLQTNTLTGVPSYFSDPRWTQYIGRFYRIRSSP